MLQNGAIISGKQVGFKLLLAKKKKVFFEITFILEGTVSGGIRTFPDDICL